MHSFLLLACASVEEAPARDSATLPDSDPGTFAGSYVEVRCGGNNLCALDAEGAVHCWYNGVSTPVESSQLEPNPRDFDVDTYLFVLDGDGALVLPENSARQLSGTYTEVEVSAVGACALSEDGAIECTDDFWCSGFPLRTERGYADFVRTPQYYCGLDAAGAVTCWGNYPGSDCAEEDTCHCIGDPLTLPGPYEALARGDVLCLLDADGVAECPFVEVAPPSEAFSELDADGIACGIRDDGTGTCWDTLDGSTLEAPAGQLRSLCGAPAYGADRGVCAVTVSGALICTGAYAEWAPVP